MGRDDATAGPGKTWLAFWNWLADRMGHVKDAFQKLGFGLMMFALTSYVMLYVPQIANTWWKLPYRITLHADLPANIGFWLYVPFVASFYYGSWLALARASKLGVGNLALVSGAIVTVLLLFGPTAALGLWEDLCGYLLPEAVAEVALYGYYLVVPIVVVLHFMSWWFVARSPYWQKDPAKSPALDWPAHRLIASRYKILRVLTYPMTLINWGALAVNYVLSGWPAALLAGFARRHSTFTLGAAITLAVGCTFATFVAAGRDEMGLYPGMLGVFGMTVWPLAFLCIWLVVVSYQKEDAGPLGPVEDVTGRILVLVLLAGTIGEFLWIAPAVPGLNHVFSYRIYTIWIAFHICFCVVAVGTWADVTQHYWTRWPMRPLTFAVIAFLVYWTVDASRIEPDGQARGGAAWDVLVAKGMAHTWYENFERRLDQIDKENGEGPYVIVAASGGGSRAALFTALVLEGLSREDFPGVAKSKWSDRIVLVSSVSGGSLATANFVFRGDDPRTEAPFLRNTTRSELEYRTQEEYDNRVRQYYTKHNIKNLQKSFAELYHGDNRDPDLAWMFGSDGADDMCTDFMAPLLRGALTARMERGDVVSRFWQQRFDWVKTNNLSYDPKRPLVVFNATDARRGNRVFLGFPQLPPRVGTMHLANIPYKALAVDGALTAADKIDPGHKKPFKVHQANLKAGRSYMLKMNRVDSSGRFDPFLIIEDPTGKKVAEDDDSGGELNALIASFTPAQDGVHRVLAASFNDTRGKYTLTLQQNADPSPVLAQVEENAFQPTFRYSQSLADFWPSYHMEVRNAVRASANFPWGFQSCFLTRSIRDDDFKKKELRDVLAANIDKLLHLLPAERNFLGEHQIPFFDYDLDGQTKRDSIIDNAKKHVQTGEQPQDLENLQQIARLLDRLSREPTRPEKDRKEANDILKALDAVHKPAQRTEKLHLLDGGVNDNTGIPTLVEVLQHLEAVARVDGVIAGADNQQRARKILKRLRERGVVFLEIDSGAKPKSGDLHDLKTPLQGMENATFAQALADRERSLKRLNKFLTPNSRQKEGVGGGGGDGTKKGAPKELRWMERHLFLCNHSSDYDVMTAWALGPDDKARVFATFYCEFQQWKQWNNKITDWVNSRNRELTPEKSRDEYKNYQSLQAYTAERRENDQKILDRKADIQKSQLYKKLR